MTTLALIQAHRNARQFLGACNRIAALRQYQGAALKRCRQCRNALLDRIIELEIITRD